MEKERIIYFDILKIISIICVIYLHYPWISQSPSSNITMLICLFAVPIFFMVNGALVMSKTINIKRHYKQIGKYFLMLIIWKTITILLFCSINQINLFDYEFHKIFLTIFSNYNLPGIPTEHLWFLYALIKLYLIVPFISIFIEKYDNSLKYIILVCFLLSFGIESISFLNIVLNKFYSISIIDINYINLSYNPLTICRDITYFLLGYYLHKKYYKQKLSNRSIIFLILLFLFGLGLLIFARYVQTDMLITGAYVRIKNDYSKIGTLIMSISLFVMATYIPNKKVKIINFLGKRTLNIYLIHMIICKLLVMYVAPVLKIYGSKGNIIKTFLVLLISIIVTELLKKIKIVNKLLLLT